MRESDPERLPQEMVQRIQLAKSMITLHAYTGSLRCFGSAIARSAANQPRRQPNTKSPTIERKQQPKDSPFGFGKKKKDPMWQCVQNCGACCKLQKGPDFASPEEIFDDPSDIELYKSLIGPDGWCIHFEKSTRKCSIYADRPYFCRVEPKIFETLYGIEEKKFNKEACSCCIDTIKAIYGPDSKELDNFNHAIWNSTSEK